MKKGKAGVERARLDKFMHARFMYDSINKAITKAGLLGFDDADCQPLVIEKLKNLQIYKSMCGSITSTASTNVVQFDEHWFGIICQGRGQLELLVYPLKPGSIDSIVLNFAVDRVRQRADYTEFIHANVDAEVLDAYKLTVTREQDAILARVLGCENVVNRGSRRYMITTHCLRRWLERVDGVQPQLNTVNRPVIIKQMTTSFRRATSVYTYIDGSTTFYLDRVKMIFYAVSPDDVILSLWVNSYGFSDQAINDTATMLQLANVRRRRLAYDDVADDVDGKLAVVENDVSLVLDRLADVDAELAALTETRRQLTTTADELRAKAGDITSVKTAELAKLRAEENLLFKNHRRLMGSDVNDKTN